MQPCVLLLRLSLVHRVLVADDVRGRRERLSVVVLADDVPTFLIDVVLVAVRVLVLAGFADACELVLARVDRLVLLPADHAFGKRPREHHFLSRLLVTQMVKLPDRHVGGEKLCGVVIFQMLVVLPPVLELAGPPVRVPDPADVRLPGPGRAEAAPPFPEAEVARHVLEEQVVLQPLSAPEGANLAAASAPVPRAEARASLVLFGVLDAAAVVDIT